MIDQKSIIYTNLVRFGFIPETLSNLFDAGAFGSFIFKNDRKISIALNGIKLEVCTFKLTKYNNTPRYLGIIHPYAYIALSRQIRDSWEEITNIVFPESSRPTIHPLSVIKPRRDIGSGRMMEIFKKKSYEIKNSNGFLNSKILTNKIEATQLVTTDISNFYHSIYTHSIPWIAIGRTAAYSDRDDNWYNRIDRNLRFCQNNETIGLPIGPDTSAIMAEFILSKIDLNLSEFSYVRYIDDYYCFCNSIEEAEKFLGQLSTELEKMRLHLNTKKTKISPLPLPTAPSWISKLRLFNQNCLTNINQENFTNLEDLLNTMVDSAIKFPQESPMKYGVKMICSKTYENYSLYSYTLKYLFHFGLLYPYLASEYDEFINYGYKNFKVHNKSISKLLKNFICKLIEKHSLYRRSDALSWAVQYARKYRIPIPKKIIQKLIKAKDPISTLFAYLFVVECNKPWEEMFPNIDESDTSWWLYTYEIHRLKNTRFTVSKRKDYQFLNLLLDNRITFVKKINVESNY